jgi:hypothetical protein
MKPPRDGESRPARPPNARGGPRPVQPPKARAAAKARTARTPTPILPHPTAERQLWQAVNVAADVLLVVAATAQARDCGVCAATTVHLHDAVTSLLDAYAVYVGKEWGARP